MKRAMILVILTLSACPRPGVDPQVPPQADGVEDPGHAHEELPTSVTLDPEVIAAAGIRLEKATRAKLTQTLNLPGEIVADPDRSARVSALVAGKIEQVLVKEGERVSRGQTLATLRIPDLGRLRSLAAATSGRAQAARMNSKRVGELEGKGLASAQAALEADTEARALEAEAAAMRDQLVALGADDRTAALVPLRAPVAGTVVMRNAIVGQAVTPEIDLFAIADLDEVWFVARVFERDLGRLREKASAEVVLNAYPDDRFAAAVDAIGKQVDSTARTLTARLQVKNKGGRLRLGLFGTARVALDEAGRGTEAVVVASAAVTEIGGAPCVFVESGPRTYTRHTVVLGESALGKVQVLSGIEAGEAVVSAGVFTLKSVVLKSAFGESDE